MMRGYDAAVNRRAGWRSRGTRSGEFPSSRDSPFDGGLELAGREVSTPPIPRGAPPAAAHLDGHRVHPRHHQAGRERVPVALPGVGVQVRRLRCHGRGRGPPVALDRTRGRHALPPRLPSQCTRYRTTGLGATAPTLAWRMPAPGAPAGPPGTAIRGVAARAPGRWPSSCGGRRWGHRAPRSAGFQPTAPDRGKCPCQRPSPATEGRLVHLGGRRVGARRVFQVAAARGRTRPSSSPSARTAPLSTPTSIRPVTPHPRPGVPLGQTSRCGVTTRLDRRGQMRTRGESPEAMGPPARRALGVAVPIASLVTTILKEFLPTPGPWRSPPRRPVLRTHQGPVRQRHPPPVVIWSRRLTGLDLAGCGMAVSFGTEVRHGPRGRFDA